MEINSYLNKVNKSLSFLTVVTAGVIGLSTYYWQKLNNPILSGINGIAFGLNSIVYFSYKNNTKI
ncbi:hypothetical protein [Spiroplasma endosymbiont of Virgichneumon dumeticola]|uniref:hypothetical protein n=1 Tax=Spiroplasma endosymbiont of Virgichneumon dumeticola TaxID=3139323 RepID=UPI0035C88640